MDRCAMALEFRNEGYNCAQSVVCAFADKIGLPVGQLSAMAGGFGGGVGGSHAELCGAVSGAVLTLSLLFPMQDSADQAARRLVYGLSKTMRERFAQVFGKTRCGELLEARPEPSSQTPAAVRLGVTKHCDVMVVTAVELLEQLLAEQEQAR